MDDFTASSDSKVGGSGAYDYNMIVTPMVSYNDSTE